MALLAEKEQHDSGYFQNRLMHEIMRSQRLRCLAMAGVYLFISIMFFAGGVLQKLPFALIKVNWGLPNYYWIILLNFIVGFFELVNYYLLGRKISSSTYLKLFPYSTSFLEAIHPSCVIWLLAHTIPIKASLQTPPVFLYSIVIILSASHINPRLCVFTGVVAGLTYLGVAMVMGHPLSEEGVSIKAVYFIVTGIVVAIVTNEIRKNLIKSRHLATQKEEADAANFAKSKFLAAASHDLRQPMHALTLFTSVLDKRLTGEEEIATLNHIKSSVRSLESLLNALLDISKLDANTIQPDYRDFNIAVMLERLQVEYVLQAESKGLSWRYEPKDIVVYSDPVLLETILRNLISNAIRYTSKGEVAIECSTENQNVTITIKDTGPGIPVAQQENIFQEFYQLSNSERDGEKGLGLGLAIVNRLSRLLDHELELKSEVGTGSFFIITLPLGDKSRVASTEPNDFGEYEVNLSDSLILVIDDESIIREGMRSLLDDWGYRSILAGSEEEAIERLDAEGQVPDIIIADLRLREEKTGIETIFHIRERYAREIPALVVSGDTAPERLRDVQESGLVMLHKPVQPAKLHTFIKRVSRKNRETI